MAGSKPALSVFFLFSEVTRAEEVSETTNIHTNNNARFAGVFVVSASSALNKIYSNKERRLCTRVTQWNLPDVPSG